MKSGLGSSDRRVSQRQVQVWLGAVTFVTPQQAEGSDLARWQLWASHSSDLGWPLLGGCLVQAREGHGAEVFSSAQSSEDGLVAG